MSRIAYNQPLFDDIVSPSPNAQSYVNYTAIAAASQIVHPSSTVLTSSAINNTNVSNTLLTTVSSANAPVYGTVPSSELDVLQIGAMNVYTQQPNTPIATTATTTDTFDSRTKWPGLIGEPLDQLTCGSCWSFGVSAMLSDRIRIFSRQGTNTVSLHLDTDEPGNSYYDETVTTNTGQPLLTNKISYRGQNNFTDCLSPYYFAGCDVCGYSFSLNPEIATIFTSRGLCANCCSGGVIQYALIWALLNGIVQMSCTNSIVDYRCTTQLGCPVFRPKRIYRVNPYTTEINTPSTADPSILQANMEAIMREVSANGTIAASYYVYPNFASWPAGVVYDDIQGGTNPGGHTINIVGYGVGPNQSGVMKPYWLCRNTWSPQWGDNGYFKILRGSNFCRIEQDCWAAEPFTVYDTSTIAKVSNPLDTQASTLCASPSSYALVS